MSATKNFLDDRWDTQVVPLLSEYIKIPCQSPDFDPEWNTNGLLEEAMKLLSDWARKQDVIGMSMEVLRDADKTPFCYMSIDAFDGTNSIPSTDANAPTILMYGHMDKQPPLLPWAEGLGPYTPVVRDGRLYGRGGADDGYAICASLLSVIGVQRQGLPHHRICIIIEGSEESSESHLDYYIEKLKSRFGNVSLVVCLDSGALTYDRLWLTSSLRGVMSFNFKVELMHEGIHSGLGTGAVADTFRVVRLLLDRLEDQATGNVKLAEAHCEIPAEVKTHMAALNDFPREQWLDQWPLLPGVQPLPGDNVDIALGVMWKPQLAVIGIDGIPSVEKGGNVLRQSTTVKCSLRLPPLANADPVRKAIVKALTTDIPYNAKVTVSVGEAFKGWAAPPLQPWLVESLTNASNEYWGKSFASVGLGGSIPFMAMLGEMFPQAQFVVTGVLGPQSNAHGPNEFLDIRFGKNVNGVCVNIIRDHYVAFKK